MVPAIPFEHLYRAHFHEVQRWLRYLGVQERDLEDVAQQVFQVVLRRLVSFDGRNPHAWLYSIARRSAASYRRRSFFRRLVLRAEPDPLLRPVQPTQETHLHHMEVERMLAKLSEKLRIPFLLYEVEGLSVQEIATLLSIPSSTVYSRLRLARERFVAWSDDPQEETP